MRGGFLHARRNGIGGNVIGVALLHATQVIGISREITQIMPPRAEQTGTPSGPLRTIRTYGPQTHRLPFKVMWLITMLTAVSMALINFCTIWVISFLVEGKFHTMQETIDRHGVYRGIVTLMTICVA